LRRCFSSWRRLPLLLAWIGGRGSQRKHGLTIGTLPRAHFHRHLRAQTIEPAELVALIEGAGRTGNRTPGPEAVPDRPLTADSIEARVDLYQQLIALSQIIVIDFVLAGDNAIVVGWRGARCPALRARVIFWGVAGGFVLRMPVRHHCNAAADHRRVDARRRYPAALGVWKSSRDQAAGRTTRVPPGTRAQHHAEIRT